MISNFRLSNFFNAPELVPKAIKSSIYFSRYLDVVSLGNLEVHEPPLMAHNSYLRCLGNLRIVCNDIDISYSKVTSLGKLNRVLGCLKVYGLSGLDFKNVESVNHGIYCDRSSDLLNVKPYITVIPRYPPL